MIRQRLPRVPAEKEKVGRKKQTKPGMTQVEGKERLAIAQALLDILRRFRLQGISQKGQDKGDYGLEKNAKRSARHCGNKSP